MGSDEWVKQMQPTSDVVCLDTPEAIDAHLGPNSFIGEELKAHLLRRHADPRIPLRIRLTRPNAKAPTYATDGASGMDGYMAAWTAIESSHQWIADLRLYPKQRALAHLGIAAEIPPGYELQVRPRSGLALKHGVVTMLGTIDSDYRGEIGATLVNLGDEPYTLAIGDRVCQLVLAPVARARVEVVETLGETGRQAGGYGSTGR